MCITMPCVSQLSLTSWVHSFTHSLIYTRAHYMCPSVYYKWSVFGTEYLVSAVMVTVTHLNSNIHVEAVSCSGPLLY